MTVGSVIDLQLKIILEVFLIEKSLNIFIEMYLFVYYMSKHCYDGKALLKLLLNYSNKKCFLTNQQNVTPKTGVSIQFTITEINYNLKNYYKTNLFI